MAKTPFHIGLVGTRFMGRAHSNGYLQAARYAGLPVVPRLQVACGRDPEHLQAFAQQFGWQYTETDWRKLVRREDVDLVDISTANDAHADIAIAAAKAGKHILCEKPMARNTGEARRMYEAAETAGIQHMMIFNYRFVPALALAKQLIDQGKIGKVYHFNAVYYQDWLVDPQFPLVWRHDAKVSGSGAHGDMNAHIIDLARYFVGEFEAVIGVEKVFIAERPLASGEGRGQVTADDATSFQAHFHNGALGSFIATRFATGRKNFLRLEIFGSAGSLQFNLENLNELWYFSRDEDPSVQGFRRILATEALHPYVDYWWPPGHILGWEHSFVHQFQTMIRGIADGQDLVPSFYDGLRCQQVLDAVQDSARSGQWTTIPEV